MGALLGTGLVLALAVVGLELYLVHSFRPELFRPDDYQPWSRWLWRLAYQLGPWIEKKPAHGLIFSVGLSVAIGMIFPAAGVIVMMAGVVSTIATQPVYAARRKVKIFKDAFTLKRFTKK